MFVRFYLRSAKNLFWAAFAVTRGIPICANTHGTPCQTCGSRHIITGARGTLTIPQLAEVFRLGYHDVKVILPVLASTSMAEVSLESGAGRRGIPANVFRPTDGLEEMMAMYHNWRLRVAQ